ncbi:isopenicillin N synthase family oxygenase [Rhodococcus sp. ACPA1]|uniref:isopenicillin N synthase family dioxygenase n=1 Tax=Rhodococcus sp. ACPA1 TaxID=2028572 RepID=UPI000BB14F21|nr:2-oxoglutarate and iron-dependent oxygenase domain-containing protein [Rhodococcus sp. ACPA1]PBC59236.1 2OG-Fe(II) oxygenase [Rhodococcus sp. ACPA1]
MPTSPFTVPTVDISAYLAEGARAHNSAECARVAAELDTACREVGFVQIVGHRVPGATVDRLASALDEFFGLPLETKKKYRRSSSENRGYSPPASESLSMSLGVESANRMNDFYEAFVVGTETTDYPDVEVPETSYATNTWPDDAPSFHSGVQEYFAHAQELARILMAAFADALRVEPGYFDAMVDHSINALKMNNYALPEGEVAFDGDATGMGAHTDFGILTILWADQVPGLQILGSDNAWHDAQPADDAFLINLGDAMARWTNDRWRSTVHRVNPPVTDGQIIRRRSAAFFFDGNHDAVIEPLPGTLVDGEPGYPPITVAENIAAKVAGLKAGVKPTAALREAARVLSAR